MRLLKVLGLGLVLLALLAVLLAWTAPAELVYRWYAARLAPLTLAQLSGSLWQGSAASASAFGTALGRLDWRLDPWATLVGRARGDIVLDGEQIDARARFAALDPGLRVEGLTAAFPARLLGPALDIPALSLLGRIEIDLAEVVLGADGPEVVTGTARWHELGVAGAAVAQLPGIEARLGTSRPGAIRIEFADLGGALEVRGATDLVDGRFLTEATLRLREPNPQLAEVLKFVGQRQPDGSSYLRVEGEMKPLAAPP